MNTELYPPLLGVLFPNLYIYMDRAFAPEYANCRYHTPLSRHTKLLFRMPFLNARKLGGRDAGKLKSRDAWTLCGPPIGFRILRLFSQSVFSALFAVFVFTFFYVANFLLRLFIFLPKLCNSFEYDLNLFIVFFLYLFDFPREIFMSGPHLSQSDKGTDKFDINLHSTFASQYAGEPQLNKHCIYA